MSDIGAIKALEPTKDFFIGIDSDGCAFDSMEIKHKECFCPAFIKHYDLQAVSKYAREVWEFVNLYSKSRGCNRYLAVTSALTLLAERPEVKARNVEIPKLPGLRSWIERESKLGNPALKAELDRAPDPDLKRAYAWSLEVNERISDLVKNVPPFPQMKTALEMMSPADVIVVSQTPQEALDREWAEHDIEKYVRLIAGQELGTKTEHIQMAAGGKYETRCILMIGDAPGDLKAARGNNALFFPVNPGNEEACWDRFIDEAIGRFLAETYEGDYETQLIAEFDTYLPKSPSWKV